MSVSASLWALRIGAVAALTGFLGHRDMCVGVGGGEDPVVQSPEPADAPAAAPSIPIDRPDSASDAGDAAREATTD